MKTLKVIAAIAVLAASTSANAWWGPFDNNGYNNGYGNGDGAVNGDFDSSFSFGMNASGRGRGNGYGYNDYRGQNGYNSYNGYAPYGYAPAPALTEEQQAQQEAFQKAQKEAFESHQEAMKNAQAPYARVVPMAPAAFQRPAYIEEHRAEMKKQIEVRRKEAEARHEAFIKRMNEARAPQAAEEIVKTDESDRS